MRTAAAATERARRARHQAISSRSRGRPAQAITGTREARSASRGPERLGAPVTSARSRTRNRRAHPYCCVSTRAVPPRPAATPAWTALRGHGPRRGTRRAPPARGRAPPGRGWGDTEGYILRLEPGTQRIVGLTILNARWLPDRDGRLTVAVSETVEVSAEEFAPAMAVAWSPARASRVYFVYEAISHACARSPADTRTGTRRVPRAARYWRPRRTPGNHGRALTGAPVRRRGTRRSPPRARRSA